MKHRRLMLFTLLLIVAVLPLAASAQPQDMYLPLVMREHDSGAPTPIPPPASPTPTATDTVVEAPTVTVTITPTATYVITGTAPATAVPTATTTPAPHTNALAYYAVNTAPTPGITSQVNMYVADALTGEIRRYTRVSDGTDVSNWMLGRPAWSSDSSRTAFSSHLNLKGDYGGDWNVYALLPVTGSLAGKIQVLVKDDTLGTDFLHPAWSPDGSLLAFVSDRDSDAGHLDIFTKLEPGTALTNLTDAPDSDQLNPIWSPDGEYIIYQHVDGSMVQIYAMGADGSNPHPLLPPGECRGFAWSPDGQTLLFSQQSEGDWDIFSIAADALDLTSSDNDLSDAVNLTADNTGDDHCPSWSPDGERIAFSSLRGDDIWPQIYTMDPDGSYLYRVTRQGLFNHYCPSWSSN